MPTIGRVPTEYQEQVAVMHWVRLNKPARPNLALLIHVPNGGLRNYTVAAKLKAEGVKSGFPDLFLPVPRGAYHGLMIEMKRVTGGTVSKAQWWWIHELTGKGYYAVICKGAAEAIRVIERYLDLESGTYIKEESC